MLIPLIYADLLSTSRYQISPLKTARCLSGLRRLTCIIRMLIMFRKQFVFVFILSVWLSSVFAVQQFQVAVPDHPKPPATAATPQPANTVPAPAVVNVPAVAAAQPGSPVDNRVNQTILYQLSVLQSQNKELKADMAGLHRRIGAMSQALLLMHRALSHQRAQARPVLAHPQQSPYAFFYPYWLLVLLSAFIGFLAMKDH